MRRRLPAAFIRGGTSKGLVFHARDLPPDRDARDAIFLAAMGSPDRYGRQLDGMGGGLSSLSKVCIVAPPSVPGADVDYTFVQVQVSEARCDHGANCGNMSSAIGPFAVDEGLVPRPPDGETMVRIHNTNTRKIIESRFAVRDGRSVDRGEFEIPGVHGGGAAVRLDFLAPGGASTGKLLPSGRPLDELQMDGAAPVEASLVDAANACVFVEATALGLAGNETPEAIAANAEVMRRLAALRLQASVAMGIAASLEEARARPMIPLIALVAAPRDSVTLAGETVPADAVDVLVRMLSNGQPHRALPLTGALCSAVAAQIEGSVVQRLTRAARSGPLRLGMPSGVLTVDAVVERAGAGWVARRGSFFRTTRRLFDGFVYA
jgi:2-methylaconitate cis-trans-isomerase PrpF